MHPNTEVEMYNEWLEVIVYLVIIIKEFLEEYCILLGKLISTNGNAVLLRLSLLDKYLVNKLNLKKKRGILLYVFRRFDKGNL